MRLLLLFLLSAALVFCQRPFKLFLKDGDYQLVSKYQVEGNRVRYYSAERYQWEAIPLQLVDLAKTKRVHDAELQYDREINHEFDQEKQAQVALDRLIASIPQETGAYYGTGGQIKALPVASYQVITDKKRAILKHLSPLPIIPGKASVVIQGGHSAFVVHTSRPQFYLRPQQQDQFGIATLTPKKNRRIVESIAITPVVNENIQQQTQNKIFTQQLGENLFKIWPEQPLKPGEYAVIEYSSDDSETTGGEINLLVWDFAYQPH